MGHLLDILVYTYKFSLFYSIKKQMVYKKKEAGGRGQGAWGRGLRAWSVEHIAWGKTVQWYKDELLK